MRSNVCRSERKKPKERSDKSIFSLFHSDSRQVPCSIEKVYTTVINVLWQNGILPFLLTKNRFSIPVMFYCCYQHKTRVTRSGEIPKLRHIYLCNNYCPSEVAWGNGLWIREIEHGTSFRSRSLTNYFWLVLKRCMEYLLHTLHLS